MPLEIKNVSYTYNKGLPQAQQALNNITLEIPDNKYVAVIGHTGSGKSTLMQLMNGLLKPDQGQILLHGEDINSKNILIKTVRQKIGLVFQYPEYQLFEETVYKDIAFGPQNMNLPEEEVAKRVVNAFKLVGLKREEFENASPFNLSGGEKRRVAIAGVLAMEPQFLILDEPTAGLDPNGRNEIMNAIAKLHKEAKISVVLVTHSMEEVAKFAEQAFVLHEGKLILSGHPREIFIHSEVLKATGLRLPASAYITSKLNSKGASLPVAMNVTEAATAIVKAWRIKGVK